MKFMRWLFLGAALAAGMASAVSPIAFFQPTGGGAAVSGATYQGVSPFAYDYDGTNDYALLGATPTGLADGKQGTVSVWVRVDGGDGARRDIFGTFNGTNSGFLVELQANNTFLVFGETSAPAQILNLSSTTAYLSGSTWRHLLASWDLATVGARHLYVTDVSDMTVTAFVDGTIDYTKGQASVGGLHGGILKWNGSISELFFHPTYIDLSVEANRRKFITAAGKPAFLGANGSSPLGVQPIIYMPNGDPSANRGSGGNFTITGALAVASSGPFEYPGSFALLQPAQLSDNGYSADAGHYYESSAFSRLLVSTDASSVDLEFYVDPTSFASFAAYMGVGVWDGTTRQYFQATNAGLNTISASLAAGTKTVEITSGAQNHYGGAVLGNRLTAAYFRGASFTTQQAGTTTPRIVVYGDSIATGLLASEPPNNGWAAKLRQLYSGSVMVEAWGSRMLEEDGATAGERQTFAERIAGYGPSIIWLAIGFNDYNNSGWTAANFGTAYADLLDKLRAEAPSAAIYAQSPIDATSEGANALGSTLPNYRTQIQTACAARAWCNFTDGTTYMATTDLADGVHPNTVGHGLYYANVANQLGISPGSLQFSASNYNVNDNAGNVTITVARATGSVGTVTVNYATSDGVATQPADYTTTSGTLTWLNGDSANKTFQVPIVNDIDAVNQAFNLTLSVPTGGAVIGAQGTATVTIQPSL